MELISRYKLMNDLKVKLMMYGFMHHQEKLIFQCSDMNSTKTYLTSLLSKSGQNQKSPPKSPPSEFVLIDA